MSKWCSTCKREPYNGCDPVCPIFGLEFEELAEKYFNLINSQNDIKYLLREAEQHSKNSACGYDEGWYNGECNAYEIVLERLESIIKG